MSEANNEQEAQPNTEAPATPENTVDAEKQNLAETIFDGGKPESTDQKTDEPAEQDGDQKKEVDGDGKPAEEDSGEKTDDEKQDNETTEKEDGDKEVAVKLPEGSSLSEEDQAEIAALVKDGDLSQEQTDKVVEAMDKAVGRYQDSQVAQLEEKQGEWEKNFHADKEIGGDNANLSIRYAQKAIGEFGSETLKKELENTKMGSHPEVIRTFARIGKAMSDDNFVQANQPNKRPRMMHDVFYNQEKK